MERSIAQWLRQWLARQQAPQAGALPILHPLRVPVRIQTLAPLAAILIAAALFCGGLGYLLAQQSDARYEAERHRALAAAVKDYRAEAGGEAALDPRVIRLLQEASGLRGLRFDVDQEHAGRAVQSLVENGRIVGWLSWERDAPVTAAVARLWPLVLLGLAFLGGFAGLTLWQLRRSDEALAATQAQVHTFATDRQTGLPNAHLIHEVLDRALDERKPQRVVALLLLDLDRFDELAETHGQPAAERMLAAAAERLEAALSDRATLGLFADGRFVAVLEGEGEAEAMAAGRAMITALTRPFAGRGETFAVGVRIGVAVAPDHGADRSTLIRRATLALDAAKQGRPGQVLAFHRTMEADHHERQGLKRALKQAVAGRSFDVEYQPIVAADGYRIVGVEALLRWNHPHRGPISPTVFIPLAEQAGLMDELGDFVLRRALADALRWPQLYVSINLSPLQLRDAERVMRIADVIRGSHVDPSRIVLEITEGVLIDNPDAIKVHLEALRALGVRVALDDFGAGYSSLAYLRNFPFDKLKIDRGFVAPLGHSPDAGAIVQAIVALGRALGLSVLVEGVETEQQRVLLRLAGCDEMQGFLFARPASADEIGALIAGTKAFSFDQPPALTA
jgi:diguanylate cyclase (GGDEF)-like protein